jgi:hypothetical protein
MLAVLVLMGAVAAVTVSWRERVRVDRMAVLREHALPQ